MSLVERDHELAVLRGALSGALEGQGSGVAVTGDSGTGKSALIAAACAGAAGARVLHGSCDPLTTPRPLGPFRDVAAELGAGPVLDREDLPLSAVCEAVYDALRREPAVLVVEDLHWVDAASVEVLRFLARRVESLPLALLVSYRDHEIGPRHSARPLLGDLARLEGLTTLQLRPLSVDGVRGLLAGTPLEAERVHALTGGNPFFVTEVAKDPDGPLPASVRDAVLAHVADVEPGDVEVLQLVATAPDRLDDRALPALGVDLPTLRRLDGTGLLTRARGGLVFRHELARQAVESTVPPGGDARLHARVLIALEHIEPLEPAVLTHHAVGARDRPRAALYARAAAGEAIRAGAHSEAVAFFQIALDHLDGTAPTERADLLQQLGFEQYMTSRLADAIDTVSAAFPLWQQARDRAGLSAAYDSCALFEYYNARRTRAEAHADLAVRIARDDGQVLTYGTASATRGYLAYHRSDFGLALQCCEEAGRVAADGDERQLALRTEFIGSATALATGDVDARARLADLVETARVNGWDELASAIYSNLAYLDVEQRRLRAAELVLSQSLPFTVERDIPICRFWQTGVRSRLRFATGHWEAALEDAVQVLDDEGMPLAKLWPRLVTALVPLRRGSEEGASDGLVAAWQLGEQIDEPVRRLAVLSAFAERMWTTGAEDPRVTDLAVRELPALAAAGGTAWAAGDLATWLARLGLPVPDSLAVAEPFRLTLAGRPDQAAAWWRTTGEPFAEAMAWGDSAEPAHRAHGIELLDQLGATASADRQRLALRRDGVAQVPARPRESTRANPSGLTNRQLEVARLVSRGFTNAEIGARLYISPKTADHHVSAVLTRLGLPNRRAVMVRADELGLA